MKLLILLISGAALSVLAKPPGKTCRSIPGDKSWPSITDWARLNKQVQGRLIATTPLGAVCHDEFVSATTGTIPTYDASKCNELRNTWFFPETHLVHPSSPMQYTATNNSCNPFDRDPRSPCTIGTEAVYAINATTVKHLQAGVKFAKQHNIRLVIRNTGHDYLGKSTGAHSLVLWTRHLKSTELIRKWKGPGEYKGPAIKLGAGVHGIEAYRFADSHRLVVVGGNCPTVGLSGGYTQGGGIGPLSSVHGLAADQVLEWTAILADGTHVTASTKSHPDLYWALRGGGGGTFALVTSMTVKAFPDARTASGFINVSNTENNTDTIYQGFTSFISTQLPNLVDQGVYIVWILLPTGFFVQARFALGKSQAELDTLLAPTLTSLRSLNLNVDYVSMDQPTFLSAYNTAPGGQWNVSDYNTGGHLIPRSLVTSSDTTKLNQLVQAIRHAATNGALMTGVSFNVNNTSRAVNPAFKDSIFNIVLGVPTSYNNWQDNLESMDTITQDFLARIESVTGPEAGAYLNEADVQQPNWERVFYGSHWERLSKIKKRYDPQGVFYAPTAVGSEQWAEGRDGRLCRVGK
ncbi:hypothetical protein V8F33_001874 [Rhypophila sp. PSN 637]